VIGHNQHIAWGITNAVSDVEDLYIEKFHPENPRLYEYQGKWEEAQVVREEITVKGSKTPIIEEVRITRHGPILTSMPRFKGVILSGSEGSTLSEERDSSLPLRMTDGATSDGGELPLALRWTGQELHAIVSAVQKMNRASNWEEFRNALRDWDTPPQNIIYADRDGNIGYVMAGAIPIRAKGQALLPMPGWTGEYEWTGYIPFDELPQTYNPEQHFIVTANNRVVDDDYPYYITHEWRNGYRAQRIRDLLTGKGKLSPADMATRHPQVIAAEIDGSGSGGPLSHKRAYDLLVQAESGAGAVTGQPGAPAKPGPPVADISTGLYSALSILALLYSRNRRRPGGGAGGPYAGDYVYVAEGINGQVTAVARKVSTICCESGVKMVSWVGCGTSPHAVWASAASWCLRTCRARAKTSGGSPDSFATSSP